MYITYYTCDWGSHTSYTLEARMWAIPFKLSGSDCQWIVPGTIDPND